MAQHSDETPPLAELIAQALTAMRATHEHLTELIQREGSLAALVQTAVGTALLRDLRQEVDHLDKLLPFKG